MTPEKLRDLLQKGEGIEFELKTSKFESPQKSHRMNNYIKLTSILSL